MLLLAAAVCSQGASPSVPDAASVLERLQQHYDWRVQALHDYEGMRRYDLTAGRINQNAAMGVRVNYVYPGRKNLQVVWESGSSMLQSHVLRRVIEAEMEAQAEEMRGRTQIIPQNYTFRPLGTEDVGGRAAYVFEIEPKRKSKFLVRGRVWVDAEDAAVVKLDGQPVSTGSFWVRSIHIRQEYSKTGGFWLLASTRSDADIRFFGAAHLSIAYSDYQVNRSLVAKLAERPKEQ